MLFKIAYEAIKYAKAHIEINEADLLLTGKGDAKCTAVVNELRKKIKNLSPQEKVEYIQETKAGNCEEYAMLVMQHFSKEKVQFPVECLRIKARKHTPGETPDHVVTVVNRKPDSKIEEPDTWGEDAFILDPIFVDEPIKVVDIKKTLIIPYQWYTNHNSGYESELYDSVKYCFEMHLTLEEFVAGKSPRAMAFPYKSLVKWHEETHPMPAANSIFAEVKNEVVAVVNQVSNLIKAKL